MSETDNIVNEQSSLEADTNTQENPSVSSVGDSARAISLDTQASLEEKKSDEESQPIEEKQKPDKGVLGGFHLEQRKANKNTTLITRKIDLHRLSEAQLQEAKALCVLSTEYIGNDTQLDRLLNRDDDYLFVVSGGEATGKTFLATYLATRIMEQGGQPFSVHLFTGRSLSLLEIANDSTLPDNAAIIFQDVLKDGVIDSTDLSNDLIDYKESLGKKKTRFILTTTLSSDEIKISPRLCLTSEGVDPNEVYMRYVKKFFPFEFQSEYREALLAQQELVIQSFQSDAKKRGKLLSPLKIKKYIEAFLDKPESIKDGFHAENVRQEVARKWFENLQFNHRLYALLVILFQGIDFFMLEEIYERSVLELRKSGMDNAQLFVDPRQISANMMRSTIGLKMVGNTLQFEDTDYENEVNVQIENYQRLLGSLVPWFIETIEQTPEKNYENLRHILGKAVGRIGIYHKPKLEVWMKNLALDSRGYVARTVAYALESVSEHYEYYDYVTGILREWIESKYPDLLWAAAVSISQVYDVIAREAKVDIESTTEIEISQNHSRAVAQKTLEELWSILHLLCENHKEINGEVVKHNREQLEQEIKKYVFEEMTELDEQQQHEALSQIPRLVQRRLDLQQRTVQDQNSEIILITICEIARTYPSHVVTHLDAWLTKSPAHPGWEIGRKAAMRVLEQSVREQAPLLEKRCFPLLKILPSILCASLPNEYITGQAFESVLGLLEFGEEMNEQSALAGERRLEQTRLAIESPIHLTLKIIIQWYETFIGKHQPSTQQTKLEDRDLDELEVEDEEIETLPLAATPLPASINVTKSDNLWESHVYPEMLRVINFSTQAERSLFRNALTHHWVNCSYSFIRKMAHALIARSHVMDGMVMDLPTNRRYGIVLVDSSLMAYQGRDYIPQVFRLIQNLSALAPIRIHHLGYWHEAHTNQTDKTITQDDLQLTRLRLPLLLPSLEFDPAVLNAPERCYFILALNLLSLLDIEDFFSSIEQPPTQTVDNNPFAKALTRRQGEQQSSQTQAKWNWKDKLFIVHHKTQEIPKSALPFISRIYLNGELTDDLLSVIEERLRTQIINSLHSLQPKQWWADLQEIYNIPINFDDEIAVVAQLDEWVTRLNHIEDARHPKDVTLTIAWTLIAISQSEGGVEKAVGIVKHWLDAERTEDSGNIKGEERIKLYQQIGSACTRLLFNFYGAENFDAQPGKHDILLRLLPPLLKLRRGYLEFAEIMTVILRWAKQEAWSKRLLESERGESELLTALRTIRNRGDLLWLESFIERERAVIKFTALFVRRGQPYEKFIQLIEQLKVRRERETQRQQYLQRSRRRELARTIGSQAHEPLPDGISEDEERELLQLIQPQADIDWIKRQIYQNQWKLLMRDKPEAMALAEAQNKEMVLNSLSLLVQSKLDSKLPKLGDGEQYGLIIVDVTPSINVQLPKEDREKLGRLAQALVKVFQRQNQENQNNALTIIMHRLGRQEIVYSSRGRAKIKLKELTPRVTMRYTPLIGPTLERYPAAQIGFILLITASEVLDFSDWFEEPTWKDKFWIHSIGMWQPSQVQNYFLREDDDVLKPIVEEIIRKVTLKRS